MRSTSITALGGIIAALSVIFMFLSALLPFMTYVVPAFAGLLLIVTIREVDLKWSAYIYVTVALLSLLILADKEAAVMYTFFFGYYPIFRVFIDGRVKNKVFKTVLNFAVFNISVVLGYLLIIYVFAIPIEEMEEFGKYTNLVLLLLGNVTFVFYDVVVKNLSVLYDRFWHRRISKIFNF